MARAERLCFMVNGLACRRADSTVRGGFRALGFGVEFPYLEEVEEGVEASEVLRSHAPACNKF